MSEKNEMSETLSSELPETLISGGATAESERSAALLLRNAFGQRQDAPHPAVGARIKAHLADRLAPTSSAQAPGEQGRALREGRWLPHVAFASATALVLVGIGVGKMGWLDRDPMPGQQILAGTLVPVDAPSADRLEAGQTLASATAVSCEVESCEIDMLGGIRVTMQNRAVFSIRDNSVTRVHDGRVFFAVKPRRAGESFAVRAGDALVEVVGTAFSVEVHGADERVEVSEGTVRVTQDGTTTAVTAGESWSSASGDGGADPQPAEADVVAEGSAAADLPEASAQADASGQTPHGAKNRTHTPLRSPARPATPGPNATEQLAAARGHAAAGDLAQAHEVCNALAAPNADTSELELYQVARLQLDKLDAPRAALKTIAALEHRHPNGHLAVQRHLLAIQAHVSLSDCQGTQRAVERFQNRFPDSAEKYPEIDTAVEAAGCSR